MKKGFTLVEMMGVIIIIGIIATIITITLDNRIKKSREMTCRAQEKNIIEATKLYLTDNPEYSKNGNHIKIKDLRANGYLDDDIENPTTGKEYTNWTRVNVNCEGEKDGVGTGCDYEIQYIGTSEIDCEGNHGISQCDIEGSTPRCQLVLSSSSANHGGWYNNNVTVTLQNPDGRATKKGLAKSESGAMTSSYTQLTESSEANSITYYGYVANDDDCSSTCSVTFGIDKTPPSCGTASNTSTTWRNTSQTITQACNSGSGSPCQQNSYSTTYTNAQTGGVYIYDKAGNPNYCTYNVYVDTIKPYTPYLPTFRPTINVTSGTANAGISSASCSANNANSYNNNACTINYYFNCIAAAAGATYNACWWNMNWGSDVQGGESSYASAWTWEYQKEEYNGTNSSVPCANGPIQNWSTTWVSGTNCFARKTAYKYRIKDAAGNISGVFTITSSKS